MDTERFTRVDDLEVEVIPVLLLLVSCIAVSWPLDLFPVTSFFILDNGTDGSEEKDTIINSMD